jgi:tight adherence protein C
MSPALLSMVVFLLVFLVTVGAVVFTLLRVDRDRQRGVARLRDLAAPAGAEAGSAGLLKPLLAALPRAGAVVLPVEGTQRARLQAELTQAGFYSPRALGLFLGVKLALMALLPLAAGLLVWACGLPLGFVLLAGVAGVAAGMSIPGLALGSLRRRRQAQFRRGLPDCLDMMVLCLEGGVSLMAALQRVNDELQSAHPLLAAELTIVLREVQMGLTAGDAMKKFGERCGLEDVRNLAAVLQQSERFGAGVVKTLRIHADTCRQDRHRRAEELAQAAAVKILFPTLLCIFPAIFVVILGPAAYQIAAMFEHVK